MTHLRRNSLGPAPATRHRVWWSERAGTNILYYRCLLLPKHQLTIDILAENANFHVCAVGYGLCYTVDSLLSVVESWCNINVWSI